MDNHVFKLVSLSLKAERTNNPGLYLACINELDLLGVTSYEYDFFVREVRSFYSRLTRCRNRISILLKKPCWFYTFTFTDAVLNNTSSKTRRDYIRKTLAGCNYVANIDFGKKNGREHYHAVADCLIESYSHGFFNSQPIRLEYDSIGNCTSLSRLSKYISKLSNHALKDTTRRSHLMYSKKKY